MRRSLVWLALAGMALAAPAQAQAWREIMALGKTEPVTMRDGGIEASIDSVPITANDRTDAPDATARARVVAVFPGQDPLELPADHQRDDAYPLSIGIGRLGPGDENPVVIVEGTSGGAHCCATFQMATMADGAITALNLPAIDGPPGTVFPTDIDGDGMADIRRGDDAFLYAFASYAGSMAVPAIYNLRGGTLANVSAEPRFAQVWRDLAAAALPRCADPADTERNGACAAYAAARARLGEAEAGIAQAVRNAAPPDRLPTACQVDDSAAACPEDQKVRFTGFEEALRWLLKDRGYLDAPAAEEAPVLRLEPPKLDPAIEAAPAL